MTEKNFKKLIPKFCLEYDIPLNWGIAKVLKQLATAFPFWSTEDFLKIAQVAKKMSPKPDPFSITIKFAQYLYKLADETNDGELLDEKENPETVRIYKNLKKRGMSLEEWRNKRNDQMLQLQQNTKTIRKLSQKKGTVR